MTHYHPTSKGATTQNWAVGENPGSSPVYYCGRRYWALYEDYSVTSGLTHDISINSSNKLVIQNQKNDSPYHGHLLITWEFIPTSTGSDTNVDFHYNSGSQNKDKYWFRTEGTSVTYSNVNHGTMLGGTYYISTASDVTAFQLPIVTPDEGWQFDGWYSNGTRIGGSGQILNLTSFSTAIVTDGGTWTISAQFSQKPTVSITVSVTPSGYGNVDGSSSKTITAYSGDTIRGSDDRFYIGGASRARAYPTASTDQYTYAFDGYYVGGTKLNSTGRTITSNTTVEARFSRTTKRYTLSYNRQGGYGGPDDVTTDYGTSVTVSTAIPSKSGSTFLHWNTSADDTGTSYTGGESIYITGNVTLYAIWGESATIVFNIDGGTGTAPASITALKGETVTLPTYTGTKTGYERRNEWLDWTASPKTRHPMGASYQIPRTYTAMYIEWFKISTITFDAAGGVVEGQSSTTRTTSFGKVADLPTATKAGKVFAGWWRGHFDAELVTTDTVFDDDETVEAHWTDSINYSIIYNPNGGTSGTVTRQDYEASIDEPAHTFIIPNEATPTRSGFVFVEWNSKADGTGSGYLPTTSVDLEYPTTTLVLYAIWGGDIPPVVYDTDYLPHAAVRIFRGTLSYLDITYKMTQQPKVYKAVNRAGNFSFILTNDPDNSILSEDYTGWSDGTTGAIDWGMYVRVESINPDGTTTYITDGYITQISLNAYEVSIECADHLAILGSMGSDIRRNYYGSTTLNERFGAVQNLGTDDEVYVDISSIVNADGTPQTPMKYLVAQTSSIGTSGGDVSWITNHGGSVGYTTWNHTFDNDFESIKIRFAGHREVIADASILIKVTILKDGGTVAETINYVNPENTGPGGSDRQIDGDFYFFELIAAGTYDIRIEATNTVQNMTRLYAMIDTAGTDSIRARTDSGAVQTVTGVIWCPEVKIYTENTITAYTREGSYIVVTGIDGVPSIEDVKEDLIQPWKRRAIIPYLTGNTPVTSIMEHVAEMCGYAHDTDTSALPDGPNTVKLFRTGGGFALDYLQKVADVSSNENGSTMAFTAEGIVPHLRIGARRESGDSESYYVIYGNNEQSQTDLIPYQFMPKKTMKNRPTRAMVRGTVSADGDVKSTPIAALVYNSTLQGRRGIATDMVVSESNALSVKDAIQSAYSQVNYEDEDWEGTLVLSGIVAGMIDYTGPYAGSGKVLSITDPRYGFVAKKFVIVDVTYDFQNCTTSVTLNNERQEYSSQVSASVASVYTIADLTIGDAESTLYNEQFVYLTTETVQGETGSTMTLTTTDNKTLTCNDMIVFVLPTGRRLFYARFEVDSAGESADKYAGSSVSINGGLAIPIDEIRRPDVYEGQYIIVNVDAPSVSL